MGQQPLSSRRGWHLALAVSITIHAGLASQMNWRNPPARPEAVTITAWLSEWHPPPEPMDPGEPGAEARDSVEPVDEEPAPAAVESPPFPQTDRPPVPEPAPPDIGPPEIVEPTTPRIDWRAEATRAIAQLREDREAAEAYVTFSYPSAMGSGVGGDAELAGVIEVKMRDRKGCMKNVGVFIVTYLMPRFVCQKSRSTFMAFETREEYERVMALGEELAGYRDPDDW